MEVNKYVLVNNVATVHLDDGFTCYWLHEVVTH